MHPEVTVTKVINRATKRERVLTMLAVLLPLSCLSGDCSIFDKFLYGGIGLIAHPPSVPELYAQTEESMFEMVTWLVKGNSRVASPYYRRALITAAKFDGVNGCCWLETVVRQVWDLSLEQLEILEANKRITSLIKEIIRIKVQENGFKAEYFLRSRKLIQQLEENYAEIGLAVLARNVLNRLTTLAWYYEEMTVFEQSALTAISYSPPDCYDCMQANAEGNLANVKRLQLHLGLAVDLLKQVNRYYHNTQPWSDHAIRSLSLYASVLGQTGNYQLASVYGVIALHHALDEQKRAEIRVIASNLASIYLEELNDYQRAEHFQLLADRYGKSRHEQLISASNWFYLYLNNDELAHAQEALAVWKLKQPKRQDSSTLRSIDELDLALADRLLAKKLGRNPQDLEQIYLDLIRHARNTGNLRRLYILLLHCALNVTGEQSYDYLLQTIQVLLQDYSITDQVSDQATFIASNQGVMQILEQQSYQQGDHVRSLAFAELMRGQARKGYTEALAARPQSGWLAKLYDPLTGKIDLKQRLWLLESQVLTLLQQIGSAAQILYIHQNWDQLHLFFIANGTIASTTWEIGELEISELVRKYNLAIRTQTPDSPTRLREQLGAKLSHYLLSPYWDVLDEAVPLIIVCNESNSLIPFNCLPYPDRAGEYWIDHLAISVVPSLQQLEWLMTTHPNTPDLKVTNLVFAGRSQYSPTEARNLVSTMQECRILKAFDSLTVFPLLDGACTIENLAAAVTWNNALHLSVHGDIDPVQPTQSALLLHPGSLDNGRLTIERIMQGNYEELELIFLSVCDSALARVDFGDSPLSPAWAFGVKGVPRCIACIWELNEDVAIELTKHFYQYLLQGQPTIHALRSGIQELRRLDPVRYNDPRLWGGIRLEGLYY